jgi:hypothetical protein
MFHDLVALEGEPEKDPQRRDGLIEGRYADAAGRKMQLISAQSSKLAVSGERPRNGVKFLILCT